MATFGKGLANGFPLSAVAGKAEYMKVMEEIFFSFTFGGDTISLSAAKATLNKLNSEPVLEKINETGTYLINELQDLINANNVSEYFDVAGHPSWSFFIIKENPAYSPWDVKTLFMQEMMANGILSFGSHNISYAHSKADVDHLLKNYAAFFKIFNECISNGSDIKEKLNCDPLIPLFKVR